jgi:hypothetical protein
LEHDDILWIHVIVPSAVQWVDCFCFTFVACARYQRAGVVVGVASIWPRLSSVRFCIHVTMRPDDLRSCIKLYMKVLELLC